MALRHEAFTGAGALVAAIDVDSPGRHAAMAEKLNLPFPMLSDPDRDLAIGPYGLRNEQDPRNLAIPATVVIGPGGDEVMRLTSRDYADRPFEEQALEAVVALGLDPVVQPAPLPGVPEPGPSAMPFRDLKVYFRGAKFGARAIGLRLDGREEARRFEAMVDRYMDDVTAMYRTMRDDGRA